MNFYYAYSLLWLVILFLYSLAWSDFNTRLSPQVFIFFVFTIVTSLIIGRFKKNNLKFTFDEKSNVNLFIPKLIIIGFIIDFIYARDIPLFSIILGKSSYMDFTGVPILHVFLCSAGMLESYFLFYHLLIYRGKQRKKIIIMFSSIILMFLLLFSRAMIVISFYGCFVLLFGYYKSRIVNKLNYKRVLGIIAIVFLLLFLFGAFGNVRSGSDWNDSTKVESFGRFNESYPDFLPKEYMWPYLYITNPLANLNNAVKTNAIIDDPFIFSIIPDVISNRVRGYELEFWSTSERYNLVAEYLNASTGYIDPFCSGGILGLYIYYFALILYCELCLKICNIGKYKNVSICLCSVVLIFNFFYGTISFSAISLQIIWLIIIAKIRKYKYKIGRYKF